MRHRVALTGALTAAVVLAGCSTSSEPPPPTPTSTPSTPRAASSPTGSPSVAVTSEAGVADRQWRNIDAEAHQVAPHVAILAAEVSGRTVQVVHRSGPTDARPLASMVKLYVLYAVTEAVRDGDLAWDRELTLQEGDKAGGSGTLAGQPAGTTLSVRRAATLMMHLSDNTATDLLIRTLGQDTLHDAVKAAGHSRPSLLQPLPTIRQDLWLEWSPGARAQAARTAYSDASPAQRTRLLHQADRPDAVPPDLPNARPQWQKGLGYFASAEDIATVLTTLHVRSTQPGMEPLWPIMRAPDTEIVTPRPWDDVAFKGGTVAGVQTGSWYVSRPGDDQLLVILASSSSGISAPGFHRLATDAAALLAER